MTAEPLQLLLTPRQAAKALAVCEKTVYSLTRRGDIRAVRIGRAVRYSPADLQTFIDAKQKAVAHAFQ